MRRHLVEHAHAGGILNEHTIPSSFAPYVDLSRLRQLTDATSRSAPATTLPLLPLLRRVHHRWDWNDANANALHLWAAMYGIPEAAAPVD